MENNNELGALRSQLEVVKTALDNEKLVNERLMRTVMGNKLRPIVEERITQTVSCLVVMMLVGIILPKVSQISTAFIIVTEMMIVLFFSFFIYSHRGINSNAVVSGDLVEACSKLKKLHTLSAGYAKIALPLIALWWVWFIIEGVQFTSNKVAFLVCCIAAPFVAIPWWLHEWRKKQRLIRELTDEMDGMMKGN